MSLIYRDFNENKNVSEYTEISTKIKMSLNIQSLNIKVLLNIKMSLYVKISLNIKMSLYVKISLNIKLSLNTKVSLNIKILLI